MKRLTIEDRVFGVVRRRWKSASAPTPAPASAVAGQQTASNVDTATANAILGNVNTYSPFGSNVYNQTGTTNVNGNNVPSFSQTTSLSPTLQSILSNYEKAANLQSQGASAAGQYLAPAADRLAYSANNFATGQENSIPFLLPTMSALAKQGAASATTPLNPNSIDNSIIQGGPQALQQGATNQIFAGENALLAPTLQQQQTNLQDQLSQQGIPLGSNAYSNAETQLGTQQNQALTAAAGNAASQGITAANNMYNLALLGQNQQLAQQQTLQSNPLALLSQVYGTTNPLPTLAQFGQAQASLA